MSFSSSIPIDVARIYNAFERIDAIKTTFELSNTFTGEQTENRHSPLIPFTSCINVGRGLPS